MTYLEARKNRVPSIVSGIALACGIVVVFGSVMQFFRPSFFPAMVTTLVRPFWRAELSLKLGSMRTPGELLQDNQFLERKLDDANVRLKTIQSVLTENAELKALMGRASTTPYILAAVLKHPPTAGYDELIIDAGDDAGFSVGNNVYAVGDVLIGRVAEAQSQTSKVRLYSSPGERYSVLIGPDHSPATAVGRGGGQYEAELPRDIKVSAGDFVLDLSLNDRPFGVVISVLSDPAQPFEKVLFAPPVNIYELRWVLVDPKIRLI
jgi:cell shape-determining protein MreC